MSGIERFHCSFINISAHKQLYFFLNLDREDSQGSGFITKDDFIKVLNSRDLGLQLNEDEIIYIVEQSDLYKSGYIPFIQVIPQLPELLRALYQRRAEQSEVS